MGNKQISAIVAAAALAALTPAAALAQGADNSIDTSYGEPQQQEEDDGFPWGLLGLLGLLGLMPRKKKDAITVDNRTTRP